MTLTELRARHAAILAELRSIHEAAGDNALDDEQGTRWGQLDDERQTVEASIEREQRRADVLAALGNASRSEGDRAPAGDGPQRTLRTEGGQFGANVQRTAPDPDEVLRDRTFAPGSRARQRQLVEANLRAIEPFLDNADHERNVEKLLRRHAHRTWWTENLLARSTEVYAEAFAKIMRGHPELLTDEERTAISVGTNANGGYLVPTFLDPTVLITNNGSSNVMRRYATVKTLVEGKTWNGVTSAGVTASWDAELAEVSDDSPTFSNPSIGLGKPQAFVQASVEAFEDISGLSSDIMMMFADARDNLEGAAHMTGTGTLPEPKGLFTAINASSTLQIVSTTAATIGEVDLDALVEALPVRWRRNAKWVLAPKYANAIKRLGTAVSSTFSGDLTQPTAQTILGYEQVVTDDAPQTQTTTAKDQEIVFADLSQYTIVDKPGGTSVEFVPVLMGSNGRPIGARGYWMHWRTGADMPVLQAGRILLDKTSA
jgi:HK97 family phage major capsid protein